MRVKMKTMFLAIMIHMIIKMNNYGISRKH